MMGIYQHFRKEEHPFIDQVLSWKEDVERTYRYKLTDFLDPREQQIVESIVGTNDVDLKLASYGGHEHTERKRMIIAPFYEEITDEMFQISVMEASYPTKFVSIQHRDVMGAFLSLGITRDKLGDIFVPDGKFQIIVCEEIAPYVKINLTEVKNAHVSLKKISATDLHIKEPQWLSSEQIVSSLRLDAVVKEIYGLSRKQAANYIEKKLVKVNFKVVDRVDYQLFAGDLISLRGKGRSKLVDVNGQTRKNKLRITTAILQ